MLLLIPGAESTVRRYLPCQRIGHLLTPRSHGAAASSPLPWACDNGAFKGFRPGPFTAMLSRLQGLPGCLWVACPDVVAEARRTLEQFERWQPRLAAMGFPVALVGQDGLESLPVPWERAACLFLGGSTAWKLSEAAADLASEAKRRGLLVHMGRCTTRARLRQAYRVGCDSVDGTAFARWPRHVRNALRWLREMEESPLLWG